MVAERGDEPSAAPEVVVVGAEKLREPAREPGSLIMVRPLTAAGAPAFAKGAVTKIPVICSLWGKSAILVAFAVVVLTS